MYSGGSLPYVMTPLLCASYNGGFDFTRIFVVVGGHNVQFVALCLNFKKGRFFNFQENLFQLLQDSKKIGLT